MQRLSRKRSERMHTVLGGYIERSEMPGLVALVSCGEEVHVETLGTLSFGGTSMKRDTIFRIASITKRVVAAAAMILVEDCAIRLNDPIDPWLPELSNRRVLRDLSSDVEDTKPAMRPITLRDLLTSTMGFGSVMAPPGTYQIQEFIRDYRIGGDGPKLPTGFPPEEEWLKNLSSLPLITQPGARWLYNVSSDVLGILIGRVSGKSLGTFLHERMFEPLGMKDTEFFVPPEKTHRLPTFYYRDPQTNVLEIFDAAEKTAWAAEGAFESGSGGLVSTVDDYFAFCRMMLNKGALGNERILSRASVELMTSDQLTSEQRAGAEMFFGSHSSWGFGMGVNVRRDEIFRRPGRFGWDGGFGTSAYVDPSEDVIGILLSQRLVDSPEPPPLYTDFWTLTYQAIEE